MLYFLQGGGVESIKVANLLDYVEDLTRQQRNFKDEISGKYRGQRGREHEKHELESKGYLSFRKPAT